MKIRWRHGVGLGLFTIAALVATVVFILVTGIAERWLRHVIVQQLEQRTGARVDLQDFHLHALRMRAEIDGLTLHGTEVAGAPPLFQVARVDVAIHVLSFFGKEIAINELFLDQPQFTVRIDKDGKSNLPNPHGAPSNRLWRDTLFSLRIAHLEIRNGSAAWNDRRVPISMQGKNLSFRLQLDAPALGSESYVGNLQWQQVELTERRDMPFRFDVSAKFTLHRNAFELDEMVLKLPRSELDLRAELPSFTQLNWNLRYRGRLALADTRVIMRAPLTPDGIADFSGQAQYTDGDWTANGHFLGHDVVMAYQWFHARGLQAFGDYELAKHRLVVPKLNISALGGNVTGRLEMDTRTLAFRTETQLRGAGLIETFTAVQNVDFPVLPLHWDARIDMDSVNTWTSDFQHFRSVGESRWSPPETLPAGMVPVTAHFQYDTSKDTRGITLTQSEIFTPQTRIEMDGFLGGGDSALEVTLNASDVFGWDDFINVIRGQDSAPSRISGALAFRGRVLGPLGGPTFVGHVDATDARYDNLFF